MPHDRGRAAMNDERMQQDEAGGELSGDSVLGFVFIAMAIVVVIAGFIFYQWSTAEIEPASPPIFVRVEINTADAATLQLLPGIGPAMAERIIAERQRGPFRDIDDLQRVKGIGDRLAARMAPHVVFDSDQ